MCKYRQKEAIIEIEESENEHRCNACAVTFSSNKSLEKHMEDMHEVENCPKCKVSFKTKEDIYKHANDCSEVIEPFMCNKCNCELISKAGLKKHTKRCQGVVGHDINQDECKNGPSCWFLKHNKCNYKHSQPNEQPWQKVQHKRHGRQQGRQQLQQQGQQKQLGQQQQQSGRQQPWQDQSRSKSIPCKNGPRCSFLRDNRCLFLHDKQQHGQPRPDSRQLSRSGAQKRNVSQSQVKPCKFGSRCDKGMRCEYLHLAKDFLPAKGGRRN